uniref:NOT2/NOT3/NOT5 C-terminal domain-containing protein n=1 Tax=Octopus bimaculoides TaxID=37653 RepID=A0A0L8GGZ6_OCTBM
MNYNQNRENVSLFLGEGNYTYRPRTANNPCLYSNVVKYGTTTHKDNVQLNENESNLQSSTAFSNLLLPLLDDKPNLDLNIARDLSSGRICNKIPDSETVSHQPSITHKQNKTEFKSTTSREIQERRAQFNASREIDCTYDDVSQTWMNSSTHASTWQWIVKQEDVIPFTNTILDDYVTPKGTTSSLAGDHSALSGVTPVQQFPHGHPSITDGISVKSRKKPPPNVRGSMPESRYSATKNRNTNADCDFGLSSFFRDLKLKRSLPPGNEHLTGLNLNKLLPQKNGSQLDKFKNPWTPVPAQPQNIDQYNPTEYIINYRIKEQLPPVKLSRYPDDVLFYLFYVYVGDLMQMAASFELFKREWRYNKMEKIWMSRIPGVIPDATGSDWERGCYFYFNAKTWQKEVKSFTIDLNQLEGRPLLCNAVF